MRFFLGVGKYTPNDAVAGVMAWVPPHVRHWKSVVGYWATLLDMLESRELHCGVNSKRNASCKSWCCSVRRKLTSLYLHNYFNILCRMSKYYFVKAIMKN